MQKFLEKYFTERVKHALLFSIAIGAILVSVARKILEVFFIR